TEEQHVRGVIAASAGNHAQGVAYAARLHRMPCTIVMPEGASLAKVAATQHYGARVVLSGTTYDDAYARARELQQADDLAFVHAFDDEFIIAGQATVGLEILAQVPSVNAIVVPIGGGGLAAGIALAVKSLCPGVRVYGVQAAAAPSMVQALRSGEPSAVTVAPTLADGIAVKRPGRLTLALVQQFVDEVVTVEEEDIARAMVLLMERSKVVAEGAAAAARAAVVHGQVPAGLGDVVVVISGGNVDVTVLSRIIEHGLVEAGRYLRLAVTVADQPGALRNLLDVVARERANVIAIEHRRVGARIALGQTEVELDLETRDRRHINSLMEALRREGYQPVVRN
ncbi:MAG: threonine ammonia-lyase, partial [Alicyclobacillaceae bacterium]|nr:threonine ammonia-lyase [Alicyclobacillaceae bacterium]